MKKKLLFITGSRGEWGYIRPILRLCEKRSDVDYSLCVTNMHLLPAYGMAINEILSDGFRVDYSINMALEGGSHVAMVKSLGVFLCSIADIIASVRPDWLVLAGDRGEQLMGAVAGGFCYLPVAHIQAGELSGNIDGMTRHAIGKYAHLHLASNADAAMRLEKLGEERFRIHNVGAPQIDELVNDLVTPLPALENKLCISLQNGYILMVQHAATEEAHLAAMQIERTMEAVSRVQLTKIIIMPNNDAGSSVVREGIRRQRGADIHTFANLSRQDYLGLLKGCACLVGNSSSGILEAPTFQVPVVNIGRRQHGRLRGANVIDVEFDVDQVYNAIICALGARFRAEIKASCLNPYGDGRSSGRILDLLVETKVDERLLTKNLTY